jgi:mono/diheme cytochrome c family protein
MIGADPPMKPACMWLGFVLLLPALQFLTGGPPAREPAPPRPAAPARAPALFAKYCFDCHGDGADKGGLALDALLRRPDAPEWHKAWKIVRHEFMPPAGRKAPTPEERRAMVEWIAVNRLGVDPAAPDPGRVTIRRLNRLEYEYSVHDLFGVELSAEQDYSSDVSEEGSATLRLRDRLPPDETAFGFENVGAFLSLSPALLERFFEIADDVAHRVVSLEGPRSPEQRFSAARFAAAPPTERRHEQSVAFDAPHAGEYRVELRFTVGPTTCARRWATRAWRRSASTSEATRPTRSHRPSRCRPAGTS